MLSGIRHGSKESATGYPEMYHDHSDLEKRSKGGAFHQDNTIFEPQIGRFPR